MNEIECAVVMLPSKSVATLIWRGDKLYYTIENFPDTNRLYQHLYFISNEGIYEDDWVIRGSDLANADNEWHGQTNSEWKKVVATTNLTLGLPIIPQLFLEQYVTSNGKIDKVKLETESKTMCCSYPDRNYCDTDDVCPFIKYVDVPKLTDNNEIIVVGNPLLDMVADKLKDRVLFPVKPLNIINGATLDESIGVGAEPYHNSEVVVDDILINTKGEVLYCEHCKQPLKKDEVWLLGYCRECGTEDTDKELEDAAKECAKSGGPFSTHIQNYEYMFKEGIEWYKKHSASDSVEFAKWVQNNGWLLMNGYWWKKYTKFIVNDKELYELWQNRER